jgi:dolichol kinase
VLFGITDLLYHKFKVDVEHTRKIVHIATGAIALTFPIYTKEFWHIAVLCGSFLLLMAASEKFSWFKSITAVERKSYGSWLFALIVLVCFYIQKEQQHSAYYFMPILVLSISDPIAALVGKKLNFIPLRVFGSIKTIGGSLGFFVSCFAILGIANLSYDDFTLWSIFAMTLAATLAEFLSIKGWDNLTIPLTLIIGIYLIL